MKVALVHDYLNQFGGAERVLETLTEIFPEAPIYTIFYDPERIHGKFGDREIKTSPLGNLFTMFPHRWRHRPFIPFFPKATEAINLGDKYDLIISDSAGWSKGVTYRKGIHISYIHSPLRYAWEPELYLGTLFPRLAIKMAGPIISYLRNWDKQTAKKPDILLTNSNHTAKRIKEFYDRDAQVLYPPVDTKIFYPDKSVKKKLYYLAFGRIMHFKKFDLVVKAFNELELPLKIVGSGPEEENVRKLIVSPRIEMTNGFRDDGNLRELMAGAKALIFPQVEDFGLVAAESIACGTPVIAYAGGGALEIIKDGINGVLFNEQTPESLTQAVRKFDKMQFDQQKVAKTSRVFSKENFKKSLKKTINSIQPIIQAREKSPASL